MIKSASQPFSCIYFATNAVTVIIMMSFHLLPLGSISRNLLTQVQNFHSFWEKKLYILEHKKTLFSTFCCPRYMPQPSNSSWFDHPIIFGNLYKSWCSSLYSLLQSPLLCTSYAQIHYSVPNFKHPQLIFLPQNDRATCKPIQTTVHIYLKKKIQIWSDFDRASLLLCGNKMPTRCNRWYLLQILLHAQHVSGNTMPIIRSSRVLYRWSLPVVFGAFVFRWSVWCGAGGYVSGIELPETCWACNKICNKYHLLHLVGILFPHKKIQIHMHNVHQGEMCLIPVHLLFSPCFLVLSNNITIIPPNFLISCSHFSIGFTVRAMNNTRG